MDKHFLKSYLRLVIKTCHSRGAPATGGMLAVMLPDDEGQKDEMIKAAFSAKEKEIAEGCNGFLVHDLDLVKPMNDLWGKVSSKKAPVRPAAEVNGKDLLQIPSGGVTKDGLVINIRVGLAFINSWMARAAGHFILEGAVEDSATAEISRSQIWQWIRHGVALEETAEVITREMVLNLTDQLAEMGQYGQDATDIFKAVVCAGKPPEFLTTYINEHSTFIHKHF